MAEMSQSTLTLLIAGGVLGAYAVAWLATMRASVGTKIMVRVGLPVVAVMAVLGVLTLSGAMQRQAAAPTAGDALPADGDDGTETKPRKKMAARARNGDAMPPPQANGGAGSRGLEESAADEVEEVASAAEPPPPAGADPAEPAAAEEPGSPAAGEDDTDWDVVPVFYGTDRSAVLGAQRISYSSDRGRRLELGRALVTVPKSHVVPQIERPWALHIPYFDIKVYEEAEDPARHFTMQEITALSREEFLALVRARIAASSTFSGHALVFVHGYNTSFDNAVFRTAQIAYDLKFDGAPFLYSWPSGGGIASYTYDRESSGQSVPFLREFLQTVVDDTGAKAVSVIAHSMGNQPTLQVLKDLKAARPDGVTISQVILAAPDVDRDNFENIAREIRGLADGVTLYAAANDRALGVSRRFNGGVPRAGDVPASGPLVVAGVDTIDVTSASMDSLGLNHSGYAENNALLKDIARLVLTGERPPEKRVPGLERVTTEMGDYWRYPASP